MILSKINIPDNIELSGSITQEEGYVSFEKNTQTGEIRFATLHIKLSVNAIINDVPINFNSKISHLLSHEEMDNLMSKFIKTKQND